jgi:uncharacterized protein
LDAQLARYGAKTGHQVLVWIGTTTGESPVEDWAAQTFKAWGVGRKALDDGLVLFILSADRKIRIEVGYGLEGSVPDVKATRIIREVMAPRIRAGDRDGAVLAGVDQLIRAIGDGQPGDPGLSRARPRPQRGASPVELIFFGAVALLVLIFVVKHPALAFFLFANTYSGRRGGWGGRGGGGGDGGGFSGGGGSSGGGGATGSW